ncbi:VOC family protein [Solicola sp. PLA-1-18]|uniref:VOC family protein n=1 Tax=Solicola sp. PLA-1-18 TaxID=3380532 RepID=UPI003B7C985E
MLFVNLPVADLAVATDFYTGLGFELNPTFSDAECSCVVVSETICVMLLTRDRFADFVVGAVGDATTATTSINCLSASSRQEVDDLHHRALCHGGKPWKDLMQQGPMYGHSFTDPDGHVWEVLHMDLAAA